MGFAVNGHYFKITVATFACSQWVWLCHETWERLKRKNFYMANWQDVSYSRYIKKVKLVVRRNRDSSKVSARDRDMKHIPAMYSTYWCKQDLDKCCFAMREGAKCLLYFLNRYVITMFQNSLKIGAGPITTGFRRQVLIILLCNISIHTILCYQGVHICILV